MTAQFQDITPPRRSIRDIPLKGQTFSEPPPSVVPPPPPPPPSPIFTEEPSRPRRRWGRILGIVILIIAIIIFGLSFFFASATVKITPKTQDTPLNQTFSADQKSASSSSNLQYALITLEKEGSTDVPGSGEEQVSIKASGQIIIYNNYSADPQALIATTRFQTPEGLVYRIDKDITVPGKTSTGPGTVDATIYADQPGDKYNVGLKDFTIPGLQGTPKYQGFYARSKTPLSGGFIGTQKSASADDIAKAHTKIEGDLGRELLEQARGQKPDNFILFDGAILTRFGSLPNSSATSSTKGMVSIREKATAYVIVFNRDVLNNYIAQNLSVDGATTNLNGLDSLSFNLLNKDAFLSGTTTVISFSLSGPLKLVSKIDETALKNSLAGMKRGQLVEILSAYPTVLTAKAVFQPLWQWSFPKDPNKIKIEVLDE